MIIECLISELPDRYSKDLTDYYNGACIKDLISYKRMVEYKKRGEDYWKDISEADMAELFREYTKLYQKIKRDGYTDKPYIKGTIYRNGTWKINGGYHRISILRYLGYKTVKIDWTIHKRFRRFYESVLKKYKGNQRTYENINHIVFSNCSCVRGNNRPGLINEYINKRSTILDIGSYMGEISLYLASKKHNVVGLELDSGLVQNSNYLIEYYRKFFEKGMKCKFVNDDITNFSLENQYKVVIMLSVDRWIKKNKGIQPLIRTFQYIDKHCEQYFIFESRGQHEKEALRLIRRFTSFKHKRLLGQDNGESKRNLWLFYRR